MLDLCPPASQTEYDRAERESIELELKQVYLRRIELLHSKLLLQKDFRLMFYHPHPKQDKFHRAGGRFKRRYVRAGNRFGKSDMGVAEDCAYLLGYRPWIPRTDPACTAGIPQRPVKGLVIAADWDKVRSVFTEDKGESVGKVFKYLPSAMIKGVRKTATGVINFIELTNGSTLTFDTVKSFMTNQLGAESDAWDFIHIDEPCPQKLWKAHARGLIDSDGDAWFTLTPIGEGWIDDYFFPRSQPLTSDLEWKSDRKWAIQGTMHDNPYLTEEGKEEFLSTLTPEERECRELGIPLEKAGRIYREFEYHRHVLTDIPKGWEAFDKPPDRYTLYYAIDPHPQTPHAVLFLAVAPTGEWFFFDEIFVHTHIAPIPGQQNPALSELVWRRLLTGNVGYGIMDPLGFIEHPITMTSMADELCRVGLYPRKATKDLDRGILAAQAVLKRQNSVYFSPGLLETIWEFERYHWDPKNPNKPFDENDHMMENFYRLCLEEPTYIDPANQHMPIEDMEIVTSHKFHRELLDRSI